MPGDRSCSGTCSARAIATCAARRSRERRSALERVLARAVPPLHLTPVTARSPRRRGLVLALRGRGARRRDGQARERHLSAEQARDAQGEARARVRLRGRGLPLAQERRRRAAWARCCSGSTTTAGALQHVGVAASFSDDEAPRARLVPRAVPQGRARGSSVEALGRRRGRPGAQRMPGAQEPLEPGQGPLVGAAAPGARRRGGLRPHGGHALPPHRALPALAPRQGSARLHLRAARGGGAARARGDLPARKRANDVQGSVLRPPDAYARYRPTYPAAVFEWLAAQAPSTELAVDVGTGNGQARGRARRTLRPRARARSERGAARERARASARRVSSIARRAARGRRRASRRALRRAGAALVLRTTRSSREVRRVLVPGGVLAVSCYELSEITPGDRRGRDGALPGISRRLLGARAQAGRDGLSHDRVSVSGALAFRRSTCARCGRSTI